jgi:type IV pilus assembly protein PilP
MKRLCFDMPMPLIAVIAALTSGCSQNYDDLYSFIDQAKSSYVGSVKPIPQFKPYESFAYSAAELRDPFVANVEVDKEGGEGEGLTPDSDRPRQPLEAFSLDTLRMVGIMEQNDNLWGLIKDSQNIVHRVQVGNYMGQNEGRITAITESSIQLVEIIPDGVGGYIERDASIAIGND